MLFEQLPRAPHAVLKAPSPARPSPCASHPKHAMTLYRAPFYAGHASAQFQPVEVPKPRWPPSTICCGPLPDASSSALCGACKEPKPGLCRYRGKPGHLAVLPRCGLQLTPTDCESLTVSDSGGSISYKYRHLGCLSAARHISVNVEALDYMLKLVEGPARSLFVSSCQQWHRSWKGNKSGGGAGAGAGGGGGGGGGEGAGAGAN